VTSPSTSPIYAGRRRYVAREIARVALRLFGERGFDDVTVDEIAAAVGISSRTFFRYFPTKDEVVLQYQRRIQERLVEAFAARPADEPPITALREAYLATSHVAPEDREGVLLTNRFMVRSPSLEARAQGERAASNRAIVALLAERLDVEADADPRPETITVAMSAVAGAAFQRWITRGGTGDPADEIAESLAVLERGLGELDQVPSRRRKRRRSA
jgi:AcrR family transcriptional regulator